MYLMLLLPTPAVARLFEAADRPAEPQERFCQAALLIRLARSESLLLRGLRLAMMPTWCSHG